MSGPIGRISAALATVHNENAVSLANLNFDFTFMKVEAPKEFQGLGSTISRRRRIDAEDGPIHRTARKLGALFDIILPKTPALLRAYGTRISDISAMPSVNPRDSDTMGIFASQIGADSTSIWAAVTSGAGAIAVHLLACMLARMFSSPEAISVWVELVEKQKEYIQKEYESDLYPSSHYHAVFAAQQELSRAELGNWDASARAWLQSADLGMALQHKQMMLILEAISLPVNTEPSTYDSVIKAWTGALQAMDNLIRGIPQQVQNGAAVLAISSWHLYPDMVVVSATTKDVHQKDPLFLESSVLTLGLEATGEKSVSWSLPLARLQYYGKPVCTSRSIGQDNSRITQEQFSWVVLGCVLSRWGEFASTYESGFRWLRAIATLMKPPTIRDYPQTDYTFNSLWPNYLLGAAEIFEDCDEIDKRVARQLSTVISLMKNDEVRVAYLRELCSQLKLSHVNYVIGYQVRGSVPEMYATIQPLAGQYLKGPHDDGVNPSGLNDLESTNVRWLKCDERSSTIQSDDTWDGLPLKNATIVAVRERGEVCLPFLRLENGQIAFGYGKDFVATADKLRSQDSKRRLGVGLEDISAMKMVSLSFYAGDPETAAIFRTNEPHHLVAPASKLTTLNSKFMDAVLKPERLSREKVTRYLLGTRDAHDRTVFDEIRCLKACAAIGRLYNLLPDATMSTSILLQPLLHGKWISRDGYQWSKLGLELSRTQAFACITLLDSGSCNLDPETLEEVFAMSSGNSIYVVGSLLCDPHETPKSMEIRRVVGNVGRAGISLLIAPAEPRVREADLTTWRKINHLPFDGIADDGFRSTSVHLSFTAYEMPLKLDNNQHTIDRPVNLIETLVSVYDHGKWVADLDVIGTLDTEVTTPIVRFECRCDKEGIGCQKTLFTAAREFCSRLNSTCIDNWEELLDRPQTPTIVIRAQKNWLARLALASVCVQLGLEVVVLPSDPCWSCCVSSLHRIPSYEIRRQERRGGTYSLPSFMRDEDDLFDLVDPEGSDDSDDSTDSDRDSLDNSVHERRKPAEARGADEERDSTEELGNTAAQIALIY